MGLFSWLFEKSSRLPVAERVWMTDAALLRGVVRDLEDHLRTGTVLLFAHFPATLAAVVAELDALHIPHMPCPQALTPSQTLRLVGMPPPRVVAGLVRNLHPEPAPTPDHPERPTVPVVLAERHFLRAHDDEVVRFAEELGGRGRLSVHTSLDAPLMRLFTGEWMQGTLRKLGMREDQPIESPMVARRVKAAQGKLAARVSGEIDADSAGEWARLNLGREV